MARATKAKPTGRPSLFTDELAALINGRIVNGESLRSVCRDPAMPASSTVFLWLAAHQSFSDQYTRACEARADALFEDTLEIADDGSADYKLTGRDGSEISVDQEAIARSRLRVDTRKWMAGKLAPKKYGDKVALVGGAETDAPIKTSLTVEFIKPKT